MNLGHPRRRRLGVRVESCDAELLERVAVGKVPERLVAHHDQRALALREAGLELFVQLVELIHHLVGVGVVAVGVVRVELSELVRDRVRQGRHVGGIEPEVRVPIEVPVVVPVVGRLVVLVFVLAFVVLVVRGLVVFVLVVIGVIAAVVVGVILVLVSLVLGVVVVVGFFLVVVVTVVLVVTLVVGVVIGRVVAMIVLVVMVMIVLVGTELHDLGRVDGDSGAVLVDRLVDGGLEVPQVEHELRVGKRAHLLGGQFHVVRFDAWLREVLHSGVFARDPFGDERHRVERRGDRRAVAGRGAVVRGFVVRPAAGQDEPRDRQRSETSGEEARFHGTNSHKD